MDKPMANVHWASAFGHPSVWLSLALISNVCEGALRKWVPGFDLGIGKSIAYFSKDILFFIGVALLFFRKTLSRTSLNSARIWGCLAMVMLLFGGLLSALQSINAVGTFLSLRAVLLLPLLVYAYVNRVSRFPLEGFAIIAVILVAVNAPLSLIQSGLPPDHALNKYASDDMVVVAIESGVRATGTFAYLTGTVMAGVLGTWAGMVLLSLAQHWRTRSLGALGILSSFACAFASGSRTGLVTLSAMLGLWAISSMRATRVLTQSLWLTGVFVLATIVVMPSLANRFVIMGDGVLERFETAGDSNAQRALGQWEELWFAVTNHPLGTGVGTEQVGGNYVAKGIAGFTQYENQFPRIVAEFGIFGFLGYIMLVFATMLALQKTRGDNRFWRWNLVVTATQVTLLGQFYNSLVFNHTASAMIWILAAAVLSAAPQTKPLARRPKANNHAAKRALMLSHSVAPEDILTPASNLHASPSLQTNSTKIES